MTNIIATIGKEQIEITVKDAGVLTSGGTEFMREALREVLTDYAAKASVPHASLKLGTDTIEVGVKPAKGGFEAPEMRGEFVKAIEQKACQLVQDYMKDGEAVDYASLPGGGNSLAPVFPRSAKSDPKVVPIF